MAKWTAFPHLGEFQFDAAGVQRHWARLHRGDAEPLPAEPAALEAWALFHNGEFAQAVQAGLRAGDAGLTVANKAACIYANYLERRDKARLELFLQVAQRAEAQAAAAPSNANAWYWQGYALGRYSQGISVAKALAQRLDRRLRQALERTIALQPGHADAHVALGAFHAEVIDKVGVLVGGVTYGARKEAGLALFQAGLALHPDSPAALVEYANGLLVLEGEHEGPQAASLYERAAALVPVDAMERLQVNLARRRMQR